MRARGEEGEEKVEVAINGETTNFDVTNTFDLYRIDLPGGTTVDDLRVRFTNDRYVPGVLDRNLIVDFIRVDETVYQSEDPTVLSTGVYVKGEGCRRRNAESEKLWCNGEFIYVDGSEPETEPEPVVVEVRARGDEGGEVMEVAINGSSRRFVVSKTYELYRIEFPAGPTVQDLKISFTNDQYIRGVFDRNLVVDRVKIGDRIFETEARTTLSTGSYTPNLHCSPGFAQSERLNCRGSFTFDLD